MQDIRIEPFMITYYSIGINISQVQNISTLHPTNMLICDKCFSSAAFQYL